MIKTLKLTKKHFSNPLAILLDIGAKDEKENKVFPEKVFMNLKDYNKMKKQLIDIVLKRGYSKQKAQSAAEMTLLNHGPVEVKRGIEEGYAVYIYE